MAKQTAVEFVAMQFYERMNMSGDGKVFDEIVEQAKQMEKEQIKDAYNYGTLEGESSNINYDFEQYYNQTYNND